MFIRREDAERFIEEVRRDDAELASSLRIEERELEAGQLNWIVALLKGPFPFASGGLRLDNGS